LAQAHPEWGVGLESEGFPELEPGESEGLSEQERLPVALLGEVMTAVLEMPVQFEFDLGFPDAARIQSLPEESFQREQSAGPGQQLQKHQ
jgi:hypothetical protein